MKLQAGAIFGLLLANVHLTACSAGSDEANATLASAGPQSIQFSYAVPNDPYAQDLGDFGQRIREAWQKTQQTYLEHCFYIVQTKEGQGKAGTVSEGSSQTCTSRNFDFPHSVTKIIGEAHTHPDNSPPSGADIRKVAKYGIVGHIALPNRTVMRLAPTRETQAWVQKNPQRLQGLDDEINNYFASQRSQGVTQAYALTLQYVKKLLKEMAIVYSESKI